MLVAKTVWLFVLTAVAEILGCYLPYLWLRRGQSAWLLLPTALSLTAFAWLLTLHPFAAGRVYAAYGGVYVAVALLWLWLVDGVSPERKNQEEQGLLEKTKRRSGAHGMEDPR